MHADQLSALYARLDSGHPSTAQSEQQLTITVDLTCFKDAAAGVIASFEDYVPALELIGFGNAVNHTVPVPEIRTASALESRTASAAERATLAELANRIVSSAALLKQATNANLAA